MLKSNVFELYRIWEETSYRLELRQASRKCVKKEFDNLKNRTGPRYKLTFDPSSHIEPVNKLSSRKYNCNF